MKKLAVLSLLVCSQVFAQTPVIVDAPVDHLFVPSGFDNNDNVEFVVTGSFKNPCMKKYGVDVKVVDDVINIRVTAVQPDAEEKSMACAQMIVPFKEVVTVGTLQGGDYKVIVNEKTPYELQEKITVTEATSGNIDDHLYAMVSYIDVGFVGGASGSARLVGWKTSDCVEVDRVEYLSNKKDTLSIMPIMKKVSDFCPMKMTPVTIPVNFKTTDFSYKNILLFARTIEGKSVNELVRLTD